MAALGLAVWPAPGLASEEPKRARTPDAADARLSDELADILRAPELQGVFAGVHVRSLSDGRTLFEQNGSKLFNPASNMKLLTTAAALWYLGPSFKFKTEARRDPVLSQGTVDGNLYIRGHGDPSLTTEELFGLVNEIAQRGITRVKGDLVVDDTYFDDVMQGPGWEQEESDQAYAAPVSALTTNFGTFSLRVLPGPHVGAPTQVITWPEVPSIEIVNGSTTRGPGSRSRVWVGTSLVNDKIRVTLRGAVSLGEVEGRAVRKPVIHPTRYAGEVIKAMLAIRGVEVRGQVKLGRVPTGATIPVATHWSRPLADIVSTLNKYSNNIMAEQLLKTLGAELDKPPGTWKNGTDVLRQFLVEIGVQDGTFVLGNGSGLNDVNRVTPEQVTRVLQAMHERFEVNPEFVASLAVAGSSGTIVGRFENSPAVSRLRAKMGTLTGVSALSGYVVTQNNQVLAFSVMMNDYRGRARAMWRIQDRIGVALARFRSSDIVARP